MINSIKTTNINKNREIIGLNVNKIAPSKTHYIPIRHKVKTVPTNDSFQKLKDLCSIEWEACTSFSNCNKILDISQRMFEGKEVSEEDKNFIDLDQTTLSFQNLNKCMTNNISKIQQTPQSNTLPINNYAPVSEPLVFKVLFNNSDDFKNFGNTFRYKIIKFIDINQITTINTEIKNGLTSLSLLDENYNTNTKIKIVGGINNGKIFYNRITEIPLFKSLIDMKLPSYKYYKLNRHEIINTDKKLSIKELYDSGMEKFSLYGSNSFNINTNFIISGGEYDGKLFKNKIDEIIEKDLLCSIIYKIPFIGHGLCGYNNYSIIFIVVLIIIIAFVIIVPIILRKNSTKTIKKLINNKK